MAFTMMLDVTGEFRPAAICDLCGASVLGQGLVLWGAYTEGRLPRYAAIDTDAAKVPATVLIACGAECAKRFPEIIGDVYAEGETIPTMPVEDYITFFALQAGILNVNQVTFRAPDQRISLA